MRLLSLAIGIVLLLSAAAVMAQGPNYPYSVNMNWTDSSGSTVTGQNVYRGVYTTSCPATSAYTKLTVIPLASTATSYSDANPPEGGYCYFATALNGTTESGPSNIYANVQIPPPPPTGFGATVSTIGSTEIVAFSWTPSTSTKVESNKVFCGPSPTKEMATLIGTTKPAVGISVGSLPAGTHYCEVTASSGHGMSGPSNQVAVSVP